MIATGSTFKFYVYELRDESGSTFYVGKGSGNRLRHHERAARRGVNTHCCCKIRKIWSEGGRVVPVIVFSTDDERAALAEECRLIAHYGRENLTNKTDGGDGVSNPPAESRERIAAARRGRVASPETRERQRQAKLGTHRSDETKQKIAVAMTGRAAPWARKPRSDEYRQKMREIKTGLSHRPETIAKMSAVKMGHAVSEETRRKISESKKGNIPWNKGKKSLAK